MTSYTVTPHHEEDPRWYRHVWPWIIIALLGSAISASVATLIIAIVTSDTLVTENGLTVDQHTAETLARESVASQFGFSAKLDIETEKNLVTLTLAQEKPLLPSQRAGRLTLLVAHPTLPELDQALQLERDYSVVGRYTGTLPAPISGRRYLIVTSADPSALQWRLSTTLPAQATRAEFAARPKQ